MKHSITFQKALDKLFEDRTRWLRSAVGLKKQGNPSIFNRQKLTKEIEKLQGIASNAVIKKVFNSEFNKKVSPKQSWNIKGRGWEEEQNNFKRWFNNTISKTKHYIYAFWKDHHCIYIGKSSGGYWRPSSHFNKTDFRGAHRVDIFLAKSPNQVPKLECLAMHYFKPTLNRMKASHKKWTKSCPICVIHKDIETELRSIFRFKK